MIKDLKDYIYLSVLWLFHTTLSIWFIFKDTIPPAWDQSAHLMLSLAYSRGSSIITTSNYYPPFFHIVAAPLSHSYDLATCINFLFLAILLFSIYGIGKTLFNRQVGLLSALIISFYPFLISMQRDFLLDFSLVSLVSLSLYFLFKTNNFKDTKYSILFGISVGCALLTKWTAIFFLIAPVLWVIWQSTKDVMRCDYCEKIIKKKAVVKNFFKFCSERHKEKFTEEGISFFTKEYNFFFSLISLFLVSGLWYGAHPNIISTMLGAQHYYGVLESEAKPLSVSSFSYYLTGTNTQVYLFFSLLALVGLIFIVWKCSKDKKILFIFSLMLPYIVFSLTYNKALRYTLPVLIFLSLISANWVSSIRSKDVRKVIVIIILVIGVLQTTSITFGVPSTSLSFYPQPNAPKQENWQVDNVLSVISNTLPEKLGRELIIMVLPDHYSVNGLTYAYYASLKNEPYRIINAVYLPTEVVQENINNFDFIIYKQGGHIGTYGGKADIVYKVFEENKNNYNIIGEVPLPDDSKVLVYENERRSD